MSTAKRWSIVGIAVALVLLLDQLSKRWAVSRLCDAPYCPEEIDRSIDLFWTLRFNYAENTGMAFSRGAGAGRWIALIVVAIVVVMVVVARRMTSTLQLVLVGVIIGGALGNLFDRIFRASDGFLSGGVVDFIDPQWYPIFNVADACVVVGGIALALTGLREPRHDGDDAPADEGAGDDGPADDGPADEGDGADAGVPATNAEVVDEMTGPDGGEPTA